MLDDPVGSSDHQATKKETIEQSGATLWMEHEDIASRCTRAILRGSLVKAHAQQALLVHPTSQRTHHMSQIVIDHRTGSLGGTCILDPQLRDIRVHKVMIHWGFLLCLMSPRTSKKASTRAFSSEPSMACPRKTRSRIVWANPPRALPPMAMIDCDGLGSFFSIGTIPKPCRSTCLNPQTRQIKERVVWRSTERFDARKPSTCPPNTLFTSPGLQA